MKTMISGCFATMQRENWHQGRHFKQGLATKEEQGSINLQRHGNCYFRALLSTSNLKLRKALQEK